MKRLLVLFVLLIASAITYAQLSPTTGGRIANATTAFGVNLSKGAQVYDLNTKKLYACDAPTASTETLTTAAANFTTIGGTGVGSGTVTAVSALTIGTTGTDLSSSVANGTTTPVITLNVPTASGTNRGVLSAADWTTFNNKGSGTVTSIGLTAGTAGTDVAVSGSPVTGSGSITLNIPDAGASARGVVTTGAQTFAGAKTFSSTIVGSINGNAATVTTNANLTGDVTSTGNATTIGANKVTLGMQATLAANSIIGNNTGSAATPTALTGTNVRALTNTNHLQQNFENSTADSTLYTCTLTNTPLALGTITVQLNGQPLVATTQYTIIMTNKIRVSIPTYKFDKISIAYQY